MRSLLDALREATSAHHRALHQHPLMLACLQQRLDLSEYQRLLVALYQPWLLLSPAIALIPVAGLSDRLARRKEALEQDLQAMGIGAPAIQAETERVKALVSENLKELVIDSPDAALGAAYVLVGSSLGAGELVQGVRAALPEVSVSYMSMSPQDAGWPQLKERLSAIPADSHAAGDRVAAALFELITHACDASI